MKNKTALLLGIVILAILLCACFWYVYAKKELPVSNTESVSSTGNIPSVSGKTTQAETTDSVRSTVYKLHPGDSIGSMKVVSVKPYNPSFSELASSNVSAIFSGTALVEGTYHYFHSDEDGSWTLTFTIKNNSKELPFLAPEIPVHFVNAEEAEHILGITPEIPKEGTARIQIQGYTLTNYPSEVADYTTLVSVQ